MSSGLASVRFRGTCFQYCISWLRGAAIESVRFEWWKVFRLHPVYLSISQQKCGLDYAWITDLNGRSGDCCCNAVFRLQQQQENAAIAACLNTNVGKVPHTSPSRGSRRRSGIGQKCLASGSGLLGTTFRQDSENPQVESLSRGIRQH